MPKAKKMPAPAMPRRSMRRPMMGRAGALSSMSAPVMREEMEPPMGGRMARMKEGGETKAEHAMEMKKMSSTEAKLKKHASMPASKAHKGLKTGGVANAQGGYKTGGVVNGQGGYKTGGAIKPSKYKEGGFVAMKGDSYGYKTYKKGGSCD
jgi:hypothetical protein